MNDESHYQKVEREYLARVMKNRNEDHSEFLREEIEPAIDEETRCFLLSTLISELQRNDRFAEAEQLLAQLITDDPDEPLNWIKCAEHYHYYDVDLVKALEKIDTAIVKAAATGNFVYQALGVKARLGIELNKCEVIVDALSRAIAHRPKPGKIDVRPESDFLPRIPEGCVSQDIIEGYKRISAPKS